MCSRICRICNQMFSSSAWLLLLNYTCNVLHVLLGTLVIYCSMKYVLSNIDNYLRPAIRKQNNTLHICHVILHSTQLVICYLFITCCASSNGVKVSVTIVPLVCSLCSCNWIKEITNYGIEVSISGTTCVPHFAKFGQIFQKLTWRPHRYKRYKQIALRLITTSH